MGGQTATIIGAGIGGLSAALGLQKIGWKVRVYEQAPELGEVGAGLTISPNATHALEYLGLGDDMADLADTPLSGGVVHYQTGQVLVPTDRGSMLGDYGAKYYQIHRADLHSLLADKVRENDGDAISVDHILTDVKIDKGTATAIFENGVRVESDAMIGCDGLRSAVRQAVYGKDDAHFREQVAYRGLVPAERIPEEDMKYASCVYIGPGKIFTRYFVRHRSFVNYVAICKTTDWTEEGWSVPADLDTLLGMFADWHPSVQRIIQATSREQLFKWALCDREPLSRWTQGPVTLLGDAAHPMLPFLGQGAAMAIEDAAVLARCCESESEPKRAFEKYEAARRPRANEILLKSRAQGDRLQASQPADYDPQKHTFAENDDLFGYNPAAVPV